MTRRWPSVLVVVLSGLALTAPAVAQQATGTTGQPGNPAAGPNLTGQVSTLDPDLFYEGWRSRQLLGQPVAARDGREVGFVRDLVIDADGRIAALILEGSGTAQIPEAVYRIPWRNVDLTPGRRGVVADLASRERPEYGLFPGTEGVATLPREFRASEVLGDYARLQTGHGYGAVTDLVFSPDGRMTAVLVNRDAASGGSIFAFAFRGTTGRWDPSARYYGLPFVTEGQARAAGLRIDQGRFKNASL